MTSGSDSVMSGAEVEVIELHMMDKTKFYPLSMSCAFTVRALLYPLTVVKNNLQNQRQHSMYNGTWDALKKIFRADGVGGLYRGYWISTFQIFSNIAYVSTYESVRQVMLDDLGIHDSRVRGGVAGAAAAAVNQTIMVPFDNIAQPLTVLPATDHLNVMKKFNETHSKSLSPIRRKTLLSFAVITELWKRDGFFKGFYRGYGVSLCVFCPSSASFWWFYPFYNQKLLRVLPSYFPLLAVQCMAAVCAGCSTTVITNPLDLCRLRYQLQRQTLLETVRKLVVEEGFEIFTKGLSARLVSSTLFSFTMIIGYESLKRWSLSSDYKDKIRW